jgi:SAM-dependent methyltransferase
MYLPRHLAYLVLTAVRHACGFPFWRRGIWVWLVWDGVMWSRDWLWLLFARSRYVECDCCGWRGRKFFLHTYVSGDRVHRYPEEICPNCEALGRQRQLVRHIRDRMGLLSLDAPNVLGVGASKAVIGWLRRRGFKNLVTVDLRPNATTLRMDVTSLGFKDDTFDAIFCSHVLEHVPDDLGALREMLRVLKDGGACVIQVPLEQGLLETTEYGGPDLEEFGHVRCYGRDFASRLDTVGFEVSWTEGDLFALAKRRA